MAQALVQSGEHALLARGLLVTAALVDEENDASLALFQRLGYRVTDVKYLKKSCEPEST